MNKARFVLCLCLDTDEENRTYGLVVGQSTVVRGTVWLALSDGVLDIMVSML